LASGPAVPGTGAGGGVAGLLVRPDSDRLTGSAGAAGGGVSPFRGWADAGERRRRRRLGPLDDRSGAPVAAVALGVGELPPLAGATTGASLTAGFVAGGVWDPSPAVARRLRRRRGVEAAVNAGASAGALEATLRSTLAPTSPSAQSAPSTV
jgi:hypothetical protein